MENNIVITSSVDKCKRAQNNKNTELQNTWALNDC